MAAIFAGIASLIIPGLGQLINGRLISAFLWFLAGAVVPGIVNILSAIHAVVVGVAAFSATARVLVADKACAAGCKTVVGTGFGAADAS